MQQPYFFECEVCAKPQRGSVSNKCTKRNERHDALRASSTRSVAEGAANAAPISKPFRIGNPAALQKIALLIVCSFIAYIVSLLSGISPFLPSTAALAQTQEVPKGCFLDCKDQYNLLARFGDNTTIDSIEKAFGVASEVANVDGHEIRKFSGTHVDLFLLKDRSQLTGVAIILTGKPEYAKIPFLGYTLSETNLPFISESCPGNLTGADARFVYRWTAPCYFGRPGRYKFYSFLFTALDGSDGKCRQQPDYLDPVDIANVKCKDPAGVLPLGVFVQLREGEKASEQEGKNIQGQAAYISSCVFWGC